MRSALRPARTLSLIVMSALAILLSGCAGDPEEPGDPGAAAAEPSDPTASVGEVPEDASAGGNEAQPDMPTSPPASPEAGVGVIIEISGGGVVPAPGRTSVELGQTVRIEVISDRPDTVHVHGYDVEAEVSPSAPAVLEFTADQPGLFEVETHESGLLLTQLVVE